MTKNYKILSDNELYNLCRQYGNNTLFWRQKFIGLLPEVNHRRLYEKRGFSSIFEFAKKFAGINEEQVRLTLNLEKNFMNKPSLKKLLVEGKVSVNKLTRINSVATVENESFWANQVQVLSKSAIETLVRDQKSENQNDLCKLKSDTKSLPGQTLKLAEDVELELMELQQKGIDVNGLLREFLKQRKEKIAEEKEKLTQELAEKVQNKGSVSRYIPIKIRRILKQEYGTKCSIPNCYKPAIHLHHTLRFAMSPSHDPHFIAPLCKDHHLIAHSIDRKFIEQRQVALRQ